MALRRSLSTCFLVAIGLFISSMSNGLTVIPGNTAAGITAGLAADEVRLRFGTNVEPGRAGVGATGAIVQDLNVTGGDFVATPVSLSFGDIFLWLQDKDATPSFDDGAVSTSSGLVMGPNAADETGRLHISWNNVPAVGLAPTAQLIRLVLEDFDDAAGDGMEIFFGADGSHIVTGNINTPLPPGDVAHGNIIFAGLGSKTLDVAGSFSIQTIDLKFNAVPEPGTAMLLGMGIAGLAYAGRTRRVRV